MQNGLILRSVASHKSRTHMHMHYQARYDACWLIRLSLTIARKLMSETYTVSAYNHHHLEAMDGTHLNIMDTTPPCIYAQVSDQ